MKPVANWNLDDKTIGIFASMGSVAVDKACLDACAAAGKA